MSGYVVWLIDGTMLAISADRCRHDRRIMTFDKRYADQAAGAGADAWGTVSILRWEDVHRVERVNGQRGPDVDPAA